jgi:serine/threonine-protein kinase HipA
MARGDLLVVLLNDVPIAQLQQITRGNGALTYLPAIVEARNGSVLLSVSLPVRGEPYSEESSRPFFAGLLPEGLVRERLCQRFRLDVSDVFGLLWEIGRDCAGAVSLVPPAELDASSTVQDGVEWLTDIQLRQLLDDLPERPLGVQPPAGVRISLAGAQDKLPVVLGNDGRVGLPRGRTPSTHILKPPSVERTRSGRPRYPGLMENEAFCLELAARVGLDVPPARIQEIHGERVLVIERYDRDRSTDGRTMRRHQEDVCQALGLSPLAKYEEDGGPTAPDVVALLRRVSADAARDVLAFLDRLAFNVSIGNLDAHAKNIALLYGPEGIRLSPAYDLVCTAMYPQLTNRLAMGVGGQFQADQVTPRHWTQLLEECGLDTTAAREHIADVGDRIVRALSELRNQASERQSDQQVVDAIALIAEQRAGQVRQLASYRPTARKSRR